MDAVPLYIVPDAVIAVEEANGKTDATEEVAVKDGPVIVLYTTRLPRKSESPRTSRMLPVVVVAVAPRMRTLDGVEG